MHVTLKSGLSLAASVLVVALLAGCASSFEPYSDEADNGRPADTNAVKAIMTGLGAIDPTDKPIAYQPRAPLVMPPKRDLATPQDSNAALASRNFPKDRDDDSNLVGMCDDSKGALSAEAKRRCAALPRAAAVENNMNGMGQGDHTEASRRLTPEEMKGHAVRRDQIMGTDTAGPTERRSLSEPPNAYRTPSANAPFEEAKPKEDSWKPGWWPF